MTIDFNPPTGNPQRKPSEKKPFLFFVLVILAVATGLFLASWWSTEQKTEEKIVQNTVAEPEQPAPAPVVPEEPRIEWVKGTIQSGDTITSLLGNYFSAQDIFLLAKQCKPVFPLSKICANQSYKLGLSDGQFDAFLYDIDKEEQLIIQKNAEGFDIIRQPIDYTVTTEVVAGHIQSSLFESVAEIGEDSLLAIRLADIFAWDIDFMRDLREGDSFFVLVEKRSRDNHPAGYGNILAAEFVNNGQPYYAVLFKDGDRSADYFDEQGNSLRKAFLKAPLSYTRISSGFSRNRYHPVLNKWKPHLAIDYAAPTGTPVKSVAEGTIIRRSYDRYNGNMIRIRHPNSYETTYIHLSRFGKGISKGKKVRQGEVIGYVGMTGIATGPHLDFRVFKNGQPINPLKIKSTPAKPVSAAHRGEFDLIVKDCLTRLETKEKVLTAEAPSKACSPSL